MGLKEEYLSDAKPGEALDFVDSNMDHVQNGEIGTLIRRRYIRANGSTYLVENFTPRGPAPVAPAAPAAPAAAVEPPAPKPVAKVEAPAPAPAPKAEAKKPGIKDKLKKAFGRK